MKLLTNEQQESYENAKICYICKEKFENKHLKIKKCCKVRDHCHYTGEYRVAARGVCNLKCSVPKIIPVVFHNESNYNFDFIIKELADEFKKKFTCLGENIEKYGIEITKTLFYILQFIDSARFMTNSLSNFINKPSEGIHRIKCKFGHDEKKFQTCRIKYKYCGCFF